ncbi:MAG TPA: ABC transporter permease subunit, partial [Candidatus Limnocylindrales bacterium]
MTLAESLRRRIVWVLLGLTVFSVAITTWGVERLVSLARENGTGEVQIFLGVSQILVLVAFMFSFVLAMTAAFLGAPAIAADVESGVAHAMLARPIRRADLVAGRWLGLAVVVLGYAAASGLLEIGAVRLVSGYAPPNPL